MRLNHLTCDKSLSPVNLKNATPLRSKIFDFSPIPKDINTLKLAEIFKFEGQDFEEKYLHLNQKTKTIQEQVSRLQKSIENGRRKKQRHYTLKNLDDRLIDLHSAIDDQKFDAYINLMEYMKEPPTAVKLIMESEESVCSENDFWDDYEVKKARGENSRISIRGSFSHSPSRGRTTRPQLSQFGKELTKEVNEDESNKLPSKQNSKSFHDCKNTPEYYKNFFKKQIEKERKAHEIEKRDLFILIRSKAHLFIQEQLQKASQYFQSQMKDIVDQHSQLQEESLRKDSLISKYKSRLTKMELLLLELSTLNRSQLLSEKKPKNQIERTCIISSNCSSNYENEFHMANEEAQVEKIKRLNLQEEVNHAKEEKKELTKQLIKLEEDFTAQIEEIEKRNRKQQYKLENKFSQYRESASNEIRLNEKIRKQQNQVISKLKEEVTILKKVLNTPRLLNEVQKKFQVGDFNSILCQIEQEDINVDDIANKTEREHTIMKDEHKIRANSVNPIRQRQFQTLHPIIRPSSKLSSNTLNNEAFSPCINETMTPSACRVPKPLFPKVKISDGNLLSFFSAHQTLEKTAQVSPLRSIHSNMNFIPGLSRASQIKIKIPNTPSNESRAKAFNSNTFISKEKLRKLSSQVEYFCDNKISKEINSNHCTCTRPTLKISKHHHTHQNSFSTKKGNSEENTYHFSKIGRPIK